MSGARAALAARAAEARLALALLSRLPAGRLDAPPPLARAFWAYGLVGLTLGALLAALLGVLSSAGLGPVPAAVLALSAYWLATGGLHEDGLSDMADGFGGGADRARKLEIMRDSRIGSYGVLALIASSAARIAALGALAGSGASGLAAIILAHGLSRAGLPFAIIYLPNARGAGLGAAAAEGAGPRAPMGVWAAFALIAAMTLFLPGGWVMLIAGALGLAGVVILAQRQIGGWTGDVLGAAQVVGETLMLTAFVACLGAA